MPLWTPNPITRRVHWSITTRTQCVLKVADSQRNKSQLHKLSFVWPRNVRPGRTCRFRPVMNAQDAANNILIDLDGESQRDLLGIRGQPQLGLRRFISTTASMSSFFGPFGPGRRPRLGENNMRYFRLLSTLWRCSRVEGFRTTAERRTRAGRMKGVHKAAMIRSAARRFGARLRPRLRIRS